MSPVLDRGKVTANKAHQQKKRKQPGSEPKAIRARSVASRQLQRRSTGSMKSSKQARQETNRQGLNALLQAVDQQG